MDKPFLFLDFDGVICDSLPECYISSLLAWNRWSGGKPDAIGAVLEQAESGRDTEPFFRQMRPFVRNGADYLFIHLAAAEGRRIESQVEFDALIRSRPRLETEGGRLFQSCRQEFLEFDRERWMELNPLFEGMHDLLKRESSSPFSWILSTKPARFILEILGHHTISWPEERCISSGGRPKVEIIDETVESLDGGRRLVKFVEDQIDHLLIPHRSNIEPLIASWGYVKPEWLEDPRVRAVTLSGLTEERG